LQYNNIHDILPLVENEGLVTGDRIYLYNNNLDDSSLYQYIPMLISRGVEVSY
jgi:hypothetical protein